MLRGLLFLFLLGCTGFVLGTLTLRGPVRWVTAALRESGGDQGAEDWLVRGTILLLLLVSLAVAMLLAEVVLESGDRRVRWGIPAGAAALGAATLGVWMLPGLMGGSGTALEDSGARFVFGPYPERERLAELKARGFSGVVTLLHPAVAPFEPALLEREQAAAREVGIALLHTPMLPWVSQNEASLETIRRLARSGKGRYYVHCYLGKDRVNVVRRLLESEGVSLEGAKEAAGARRLADKPAFERGSIYHLDGDVHVAPYPTDEEWFGYVLSGSVKQVLSLLDPESPEDTALVAKERALTAQYRMPLEFAPIRTLPYDPAEALAAARRAKALPRPLMVHAFRTYGTARTEAFVQAYRTDLPPLPPALFGEPMQGGPVRVVGVNVAVGPLPAGPEMGGYLRPRGLRGVVFLGPEGHSEAVRARRSAELAGLRWVRMDGGGPALLELLSRGGPWYVFGPGLAAARAELEARLDPATSIPRPAR